MNQLTGSLYDAIEPERIEQVLPPSRERRRLRAYILLLCVDAALIHLCFALAAFAYEGVWWTERTMLAAQAMLPVFMTIALYNKTYSGTALREWTFAVRQALTALAVSAALINFLAFYTKSNAEFSRGSVTLGLILTAIALVAVRRLATVFVERYWGGATVNQLIIDDGGVPFSLPRATTISAQRYGLDATSRDPFMLDRLGKLLRYQEKVIVSCPRERHAAWSFLLKSAGVNGEIASEPIADLGALGINSYEGVNNTTLVVSRGPLGLRSRVAKRLFDLVVAGVALVVLSPLLLFVALRIKLEDGGSILFVQRRLGRGNQFFDMYKFRSMRPGKLDADGAKSTARNDDRVTKIGAFMRRTSIDELPQLLNVLKGEMSIVGPRPHALGSRANDKYFWEVDAQYWARHCLKPGLTGLAQVRGHRGATVQEKDLTDRLQSDLEYVAGWSLRRDLEIVLATVSVLNHDRAY
ncbi:MAG: sugar transferase [Erythrobacter sp.]